MTSGMHEKLFSYGIMTEKLGPLKAGIGMNNVLKKTRNIFTVSCFILAIIPLPRDNSVQHETRRKYLMRHIVTICFKRLWEFANMEKK